MFLDTLLLDSGPDAYYTEALRTELEDHMTFLRNDPGTASFALSDMAKYRYEGDLYGLFSQMGIPEQYKYVVMRVNQLTSPMVVPEDLHAILIPSYSVIDKIRQAAASI